MPNWCAGNIRFRGKLNDILNLLKEKMLYCRYSGTTEKKPAIVTYDDFSIEIKSPYEDADRSWCYIDGTHRNFLNIFGGPVIISECICFETEKRDANDNAIVVFDNFQAAWSIEPAPYVEMSKKYNVDICIMGWERGMGFSQCIIVEDGIIIEDSCSEHKSYYDWMWKTAMPYLGG